MKHFHWNPLAWIGMLAFCISMLTCNETPKDSSSSTPVRSAAELLSMLPESARVHGDAEKGEIELNPTAGPSELLYEDAYIAVVRDPVKFPGGKEGKYLRIIEKSSLEKGIAGVVIVPKVGDKLVLLRTFRHPTRSWEIEFPRGFSDPGQSPEENALREAKEELGTDVVDLVPLGTIKCNTGLMASVVLVFEATAKASSLEQLSPEDKNEAIGHYLILSRAELAELIRNGSVADGFTLGALALLDARQP